MLMTIRHRLIDKRHGTANGNLNLDGNRFVGKIAAASPWGCVIKDGFLRTLRASGSEGSNRSGAGTMMAV
jgi:hypothetical protein